jgi:hypothetical protein
MKPFPIGDTELSFIALPTQCLSASVVKDVLFLPYPPEGQDLHTP